MLGRYFMGAVLLSSLMTLLNWRRGLFLMIVVATLQDPIRKLMPGTPGYMVLATLPIWIISLVTAFSRLSGIWESFRNSHRDLSLLIIFFAFSLVPASLVSATYGPGSWQLTLIGFFSYGSVILGWLFGFAYLKRVEDLPGVLASYCVVTSVALVGAAFEYLDMFTQWNALGTRALGNEWIRYIPGYEVRMIAGFYRSPDVMGWHAAMTAMLATSLAVYGRYGRKWVWVLIASWGVSMVMLCGRRKMSLMLPIFVATMLWAYLRSKTGSQALTAAGILLGVAVLGYTAYEQLGRNPGVEEYYFRTLGDVPYRVRTHGYEAVITTYKQSGFWGEGLGTATQGTQHLSIARPRIWQEGGLEKLLVELGVPGFVCFILLAVSLIVNIFKMAITRMDYRSPSFPLFAGLSGIVLANSGSFVVSQQIFGDPFIVVFFSVLTGILLSFDRPGLGGGKTVAEPPRLQIAHG